MHLHMGEPSAWDLGPDLDVVGPDLDMVGSYLDVVGTDLDVVGPDLDVVGLDLDLDMVEHLGAQPEGIQSLFLDVGNLMPQLEGFLVAVLLLKPDLDVVGLDLDVVDHLWVEPKEFIAKMDRSIQKCENLQR